MTSKSIGSAIAPSWLAGMTIGSLFISIFGLALFSSFMLGTNNVDILSILEASQGLPNLLDRLGVLIRLYEKLAGWIPTAFANIPEIPVVEFFTFVINALLKLVQILLYIITLVPVIFVGVACLPIWLAVDTINILGSILAALNGSTFHFIDMNNLYKLVGLGV